MTVSGVLNKQRTRDFAEQLHIANVTGNNVWLEYFENINDLVSIKVCGESSDVNADVCNKWISNLLCLWSSYSPNDLHSANEISFFSTNISPPQHLHLRVINDMAERTTLLLDANMSGTEKLPLLLIGISKTPRCFKDAKTLPVNYKTNKKLWDDAGYFHRLAERSQLTNEVGEQKNCLYFYFPTQQVNYPWTKVYQELQALVCREEIVRIILSSIEQTSQQPGITILCAMWIARKAGFDIKLTKIANCFKKCGFGISIGEVSEDGIEEITRKDWCRVLIKLPYSSESV
ncbi:hypothetical protein PR048_011702 [Dryococelus australis]|uniref:DDE-1 domain-containing protein n=1 Tax=Dryococelus australis TaxID=614101 RepID=A0ABQ9HMY0_9NEOP|nr:hypothetical protein PR048_011702 [Dryococelus australis]